MGNNNNSGKIHPLMRIPVPWVFLIPYLVGVGIQFIVPLTISSVVLLTITQVLSILLLVVGVTLAAWAQWLFRKEHTTTDPNQTSTRLITWGPYRFSRNPMYIGLFLIFIGISGIFTLFWSLILLLFVVYYLNWIVIPVEEKQLRKNFGEAYEQYCERVRRWI